MPHLLSKEDLIRYSRHLSLSEIGVEGQIQLKNSSVLIIGAGGLGSPASLYLAAAGVGRLGIMDSDRISLSNLQRQILYSNDQQSHPKASSAKSRLNALNPLIEVQAYDFDLDSNNIDDLFPQYDIIVDGTDNFQSRYLINDTCVKLHKPNIYGAIQGFFGQVSVFSHNKGPCYRCLFPEAPSAESIPSCNENGVLGVLPGVIGTLQATEALKILLKIGTALSGRLLSFDALEMTFSIHKLNKNKNCQTCGKGDSNNYLNCNNSLGTENPMIEINELELVDRLNKRKDTIQLVDVRTDEEFRYGHFEDSIHIPLHELAERYNELNPSQETILYCHAGVRSMTALHILQSLGFKDICHLKGGISRCTQLKIVV